MVLMYSLTTKQRIKIHRKGILTLFDAFPLLLNQMDANLVNISKQYKIHLKNESMDQFLSKYTKIRYSMECTDLVKTAYKLMEISRTPGRTN